MQRRKDNKGRVLQDGESLRKDGRYQYRYTTLDKKRKTIYAKTLDELREKEKEIKVDIYSGFCLSDSDITLNQMFDKCCANRELLKPSTKTVYEYAYGKHVRNTIGNKRMRDIRYTDILLFFKYLADEQQVGMGAICTVSYTLHAPFKMALRDGIIKCDPVDGVLDEIKKAHNWQSKRRKAADKSQVETILNFIKKTHGFSRTYNMYLVLYLTGMRVSEMCGLMWEDCDFENNTINIKHNLIYTKGKDGSYTHIMVQPKSQSGIRTIPMLSKVRDALLAEKALNRTISFENYSGFVFGTLNNTPFDGTSVGDILKRIIKRYNKYEAKYAETEQREPVYIENFTAHQLRHLFCSMLCEQGVSPKTLQEIMGHANFSVTMDVYTEFTAERKQTELQQIEKNLSFQLI